MKIETQQDIDVVNGKFNHFHDGFIKAIRVTSDSEFFTDMPWEEQRQFTSNEEELLAAGRSAPCPSVSVVRIEIHHYNYDWPNQPLRRSLSVRASAAHLCDRLLSFIGGDIFDLTFRNDSDGISCVLTYHEDDVGHVHTMENGTATVLFSSDLIEIEESEWAEQNDGQISSESGPPDELSS
jgi:hypothetical protein